MRPGSVPRCRVTDPSWRWRSRNQRSTLPGSTRPAARGTGGAPLARFVFATGTLTLTEAGSKRRASLYVLSASAQLARHDPGGLEVLTASFEEFRARLLSGNHTLKRSLTDPHLFS